MWNLEAVGGILKTIQSNSIQETHSAAKQLVLEHLQPGDLLLLSGEMGAGKTTFVQGIASAMNLNQTINSPTFTRLHIYQGDWTLNHLDLYNINDLNTLESFGIYDYLEPEKAITVVEWWQKFPALFENLPHWHIEINITEVSRNIHICFRETACLTKNQN